MLTPLDIRNKEFHKAFRGYTEEEVDEFLDLVVKNYEALFKENVELKETLAAKDSNIGQYRDLEETIKKTLVIAQQTAEDIKAGALRESVVITQEAQLQAEKIIAVAEEKVRKILSDYQDVRKETLKAKANLRSILLSHLEILGEEEFKFADDSLGQGG